MHFNMAQVLLSRSRLLLLSSTRMYVWKATPATNMAPWTYIRNAAHSRTPSLHARSSQHT